MTKTTFAGVYKIPEAARYLYVTSPTSPSFPKPMPRQLMSWMRQGITAVHLTNVSGRHVMIDFQDLVSMRVISFLHGMGVSLSKIRQAKAYLEDITDHPHPFATEILWTETVGIFAEIGPMLITASKSGQLPFLDMVKQNLVNIHGMTFSQGVADSWSPCPGILLRPNIELGAPCIAETGIPTQAILRMFLGGDTISLLALSYGIKQNRIQQALEWENTLAEVTFTRKTQTPTLLGG